MVQEKPPARDRTLQKNAEALRLRYNFDETFVTEAALTEALDALTAELADIPPQNPAGTLLDWLSDAVPGGYLSADGAAISRETYADLFAVIGTVYGIGNGSTTFNLPDTRGRVTVDCDASQAEFDAMGEKGGHKLMQAHVHGSRMNSDALAAAGTAWPTNTTNGNGWNTFSYGGGDSQNLQPYIVIKKIIKY